MNWSFRILQVFGIDIRIHITFFLILLLGPLQFVGALGLVTGTILGIVLILLLFVCVTLHELGHALVAQRLGIPVREIVLLPIGGVALLSRNPSRPLHELLIALAGPLVNVFIAIGLALIFAFTALLGGVPLPTDGSMPDPTQFSLPVTLLLWLLVANILLVLFNMIPAFPLDGGRVLRAVLAMGLGYPRATRIAVAVGQFSALVLVVTGVLIGNLGLVLVAIFVFFAAGQENADSQARTLLTTLQVGDAYNKHALTLGIGDRVSKVVDYILTSYQPDFAVLQGSQLIGIITRDDVLRALSSDTRDLLVQMIMRREIVRVAPQSTLDDVRQIMSDNNTRVVAVYDGEQYLGLVSIEDIAEATAIIAYLQRQQAQAQPGAPAAD